MQNDIKELRDAMFTIFSAGFEAGQSQSDNLQGAFEDWWKMSMLQYLPPASPLLS